MIPPFTRWVLCLSLLVACNPPDNGGGTQGPSNIGPEGGLIDFDASAIPAPWDDAGKPSSGDDGGMPSGDGGETDSGAGDALAPSCTGTPTACSAASDCAAVRGCSLGGSCTGLSADCFAQFSDILCIGIQGCVWDSSTSSCSGSSWPCNLFTASATCVGQEGCSWTPSCTGTPTPCSLIPAADCAAQPGCFLQ